MTDESRSIKLPFDDAWLRCAYENLHDHRMTEQIGDLIELRNTFRSICCYK